MESEEQSGVGGRDGRMQAAWTVVLYRDGGMDGTDQPSALGLALLAASSTRSLDGR